MRSGVEGVDGVDDVGGAAICAPTRRGFGHPLVGSIAIVLALALVACSNDKRAKEPAAPAPAVVTGQGGSPAEASASGGSGADGAGGVTGNGGAGGRTPGGGQGGATGGAACKSNSDCKIAADYCTGCLCRPLGPGESVPPCSGPGVRCFADPCLNKQAACRDGRCVAADAGQAGYDPCAGKACGALCNVCPPNDTNCAETAVVKQCDAAGKCGAGDPGCRAR
jgi:hypothetical protein